MTTLKNTVDKVVTEWGVAELRGRSLTQRARSLTATRRPEPTASGLEHEALLAALMAGNADAARAAAAAHRARASAEILAVLRR